MRRSVHFSWSHSCGPETNVNVISHQGCRQHRSNTRTLFIYEDPAIHFCMPLMKTTIKTKGTRCSVSSLCCLQWPRESVWCRTMKVRVLTMIWNISYYLNAQIRHVFLFFCMFWSSNSWLSSKSILNLSVQFSSTKTATELNQYRCVADVKQKLNMISSIKGSIYCRASVLDCKRFSSVRQLYRELINCCLVLCLMNKQFKAIIGRKWCVCYH